MFTNHQPLANPLTPQMKTIHIDIGEEFGKSLGPRFRKLGDYSGEEFRQKLLEPAFLAADTVVVYLDGIKTFSASFFEEAFGGLARKYGSAATLAKIRFNALKRAYLIPMIEEWIKDADSHRAPS